MKPFFIGDVKIDHPVALAPMEHVTNSVFRRMVKPFGASLMFTEFCSSDGLLYGREKLWNMVRFHESERPMAVQIFGSDPRTMAECAKKMEDLGADILDINCGCSVPKMSKINAGAYLTRLPSQLRAVMEAVKRAVKIPVTIKVRKGWDEDHITCFEIARMAEALGFSAVTVHGRTSVQGYGGKADWDTIDAVARSVKIPVMGSGDITTAEEAYTRLSQTAVSAIMIGRGVMGNPWIFSDIRVFLKTGENPPPPVPEEKMKLALRHLELACEELGEKDGLREMRRHLTWYIRDLPGAASYRGKLSVTTRRQDLQNLIQSFYLEARSSVPAI